MAALRSEDAARGEWRRLQQRYDRELGGLELRVQRVDLGSRGVFFRVQGGSVSEAAARGICARLEEQGQACLVVAP